MCLAEEQVPEPHLFCLDLELLYDGDDCLPPCDVITRKLKASHIYSGKDFFLEETERFFDALMGRAYLHSRR
jgi:hypothetical protein